MNAPVVVTPEAEGGLDPRCLSSPAALGSCPPWHWGPWGTAAGAEGRSVTWGKAMSEAGEDPRSRIESLINTVL